MSKQINNDASSVAIALEGKTSHGLTNLWKDIREAVTGSQQDFTEGSIGRAILLLSIPMVLEMLMESVFAVVDIFFVSKLGADAVATVGLTESMLTIIYAIAIGLAMATTAIVARRIGEKNRVGAAEAAVQAIAVGMFVSLPIGLMAALFGRNLLHLMGASSSILATGYLYPTILLGGNVVIMLLFIINAIFRGAGDAAIAMRVLWLANFVNIVLDPCLIFGLGPFPELGVAGAAIATTIGRGIGVLFQFMMLGRDRTRVRVTKKHLRLEFGVMKRLVRLSLGGIGQFLIATSSWVALVRIIAIFGSEALAGYTIAIRIILLSILPSWGMSNAAATLVGQNLGAKKPQRAERSVWMSAFINMLFLGAMATLFHTYAETLIRLFTTNAQVIAIGSRCMHIITYGYLFYAYGMVIVQAFNGAGDTTTPTIVNFFCFWLFEIPLAYILAVSLGMEQNGVFYAIMIAESSIGIVAIMLFRRGRWKTRQV